MASKNTTLDKDSYYFPHFFNARNDRKILRARMELGIEAYSIFFMLLEVLREQGGYKYPFDDIDILAKDFDTSKQKIETVINNYGLFEISDDNDFFSINLFKYMAPYHMSKVDNMINGIKGNLIRYGYIDKKLSSQYTNQMILDKAKESGFNTEHISIPSPPESGASHIGIGPRSQLKENKPEENKIKEIELNKNNYTNPSDFSHYTGEPEKPTKSKLNDFLNCWNENITKEQLPSTLNLSPTGEQLNFIQITEFEDYKQCVDHYSKAYDFNKSKMAGFRSSLSQKFIMNWYSEQSIENCKQRSEIGRKKNQVVNKDLTEDQLKRIEEVTF